MKMTIAALYLLAAVTELSSDSHVLKQALYMCAEM